MPLGCEKEKELADVHVEIPQVALGSNFRKAKTKWNPGEELSRGRWDDSVVQHREESRALQNPIIGSLICVHLNPHDEVGAMPRSGQRPRADGRLVKRC